MASSFDISKVFSQLTDSYLKLPLVQKIVFPALIIGSVAGIIFVSRWANRPDFAVLYSDLEQGDAAAVVERLKEQKVAYEIRADGRTIAISPPSMIPELRMSLASEGVPKGGKVGLELFDLSNLGATQFQEKIKFQRALQGELERTITTLAGVASARVHITQPERTVFARKGSEPTASVMLRLKGSTELTKQQIKGIAHLVAGSVEGLTPQNVTIVDVVGNLLFPGEEEEQGLAGEATRLAYQREVERGYVQRVEQMLAKMLGPGKAIARVTADMDFSANEREEESYDPGGQVVRSERTIEEGQGGNIRGGVPGVVSNITTPELLSPPDAGRSSSNRSETVRNFEVSRAVTRVSHPRGKVTRVSVAVLVDGAVFEAESAPAAESGSAAPPAVATARVALDDAVLQQIEGIVKTAIGFDQLRGDSVTVERVPFFKAEALSEEEVAGFTLGDGLYLVERAGPWVFALLFLLLVAWPLVRFLITPTEAEVDLQRLLPTGIEELEKELDAERSKSGRTVDYEPSVDLEQLEELMSENSRVVRENPQQAALLIRYWLNDGRM